MLNSLITVVIPTHNRPKFLIRSIDYWSKFNISLFIADSSIEYSKPVGFSGNYFHTPNLSMAEKIYNTLCEVSTPYVALCSDDDFITKSGLISSVDFLEKHNDFSSAQGRMVRFYLKKNKSVECYPAYTGAINNQNNHDDAQNRVIQSMSSYMLNYYAVHRTASLKEAFRISKSFFGFRCWELNVSMTAAIYGKHTTLPCFYFARDDIDNSGGQSQNPYVNNWIRHPENRDGLRKWRNEFSHSFANHENKSLEIGKIVFDSAIKSYVNPYKNIKSIIKTFTPFLLIRFFYYFKNFFEIDQPAHSLISTKECLKLRENFANEDGYPWSDQVSKDDWELIEKVINVHNIQ
jgi:glycosyltransferase domain-containing protein